MTNKILFPKQIHNLMSYKAPWMIIDGPRGCGKTVESIQICIERFEAGKGLFVWIRDDDDGIKQAFGANGEKMTENLNYAFPDRKNEISLKRDMVFYNGVHVGYAIKLSTPEKVKGGGYKTISTIVYDEFVEEQYSRKRKVNGRMELIMSIIESTARMDDIMVLMLANRFSLYNEVYQYFEFKQAPGSKVERSPRKYYDRGELIDLGKDVICAHLNPVDYIKAKKNTLLGRVAGASDYGKFMFENIPMDSTSMLFESLPNDVRGIYNVKIFDKYFSLWCCGDGLFYIRNRRYNNLENRCLDISEVQNGVPYIGDRNLSSLKNQLKEGRMLFQNNATRQRWLEALL